MKRALCIGSSGSIQYDGASPVILKVNWEAINTAGNVFHCTGSDPKLMP